MTAPIVAIVGAGIAGSAAAYALSQRGARVHVFEKFARGHAEGASHGPTRLIRRAYFEHPDYVPLLDRAYAGWDALEDACSDIVFRRTGLMEAGPAESVLVSGILRAAKDYNLPLTELSPADVKAKTPFLNLKSGWVALFEEDGGYLLAEKALTAFQLGAAAAGAHFHWSTPVKGLHRQAGAMTINAGAMRLSVDRIVIAPGPWSNSIFADLELNAPAPIKCAEKAHCWFAAKSLADSRASAPFGVEDETGQMYYGFPDIDGAGVKIGAHYGGADLNEPSDRARAFSSEENDIVTFARDIATGLDAAVLSRAYCLYERSPDGDFIIDRAQEDERISYAVGLSGHGFKFAPLIGQLLADLATDATLPPEAKFLSAARFLSPTPPTAR
ncbi:MAG: N-methyl-L-tryptophan oxidase [Marinicaulis sp.]|nr:N-methyl-L-tryptophan oxidase [Marinicaulis sp.]